MSTFPTAMEARAGSRNNLAIHAEIRAVEREIYGAIASGRYEVEVTSSPMTDPLTIDLLNEQVPDASDYFATLFTDVNERTLSEQITIVQKTFLDLGYQITPLKNSSTGNTFKWRILW
jgi:hypothetical protein